MALHDEERAREIADVEALLGVLNHPGWDSVLVPLFYRWLAEATAITTNVDLSLGQRDKASGLAEAWGRMAQLKRESSARIRELREAEQLEQSERSRGEDLVGAKAEEQWYEQRSEPVG